MAKRAERPANWREINERALRRVAPWPDPGAPPLAMATALSGEAPSVRLPPAA